jgi:hypothetical protein
MKSTKSNLLSADVQLKVIAIHKETQKEFEKIMTYAEWMALKKDNRYNYKAVQI